MKKLGAKSFQKAAQSIKIYGRPLENAIFQNYFFDGSEHEIINELKKFQNEDGGFAQGIESDFRLPLSSPMATSIGIRLLTEMDGIESSKKMIKEAIGYLETSFDEKRNGWFAVPKEVNNFPHAFWWHFNEEDRMTIIDRNWGNPSAEIVSYLYKYREYVEKLNVDSLVEYAIRYIENKQEFNSDSEIYCYIKLHNVLPDELQKRLEKRIVVAIEQVIVYDEKEWHDYVPTPVGFVKGINNNRFGVLESKLNSNLDFIIRELESNGKIIPPWGESYYQGDLKEAYNEWIGVLSLKAVITLDEFNRIER